jgi:hypothetical protein
LKRDAFGDERRANVADALRIDADQAALFVNARRFGLLTVGQPVADRTQQELFDMIAAVVTAETKRGRELLRKGVTPTALYNALTAKGLTKQQ